MFNPRSKPSKKKGKAAAREEPEEDSSDSEYDVSTNDVRQYQTPTNYGNLGRPVTLPELSSQGSYQLSSTNRDNNATSGSGGEGSSISIYNAGEFVVEPKKFFTVRGRVLSMMWSEPSSSRISTAYISKGAQQQMVLQKPRYFIVWLAKPQHCLAVAIHTHLGRGIANVKNVTKHHHGIVYTGKTPPSPLRTELPVGRERGMQPEPIRVHADKLTARLDPLSRIDYSKLYTIEYNIPVKNFGTIVNTSVEAFYRQLDDVLDLSSIADTIRGALAPSAQPTPAAPEVQRTRAPSTAQTSNADIVRVTRAYHASLMRDKNFTQEEADEHIREWLKGLQLGSKSA